MATCHVLVTDLEEGPVNRAVLQILPWLRAEAVDDVRVLSVMDGGIRRRFAAVTPVTAANEYRPRRPSTLLREMCLGGVAEKARSVGLRRRLGAGSVYLADVGAARLLHWVAPSARVVGHLRRDDGARLAALDPEDRAVLRRVDHWVVDDEAGSEVSEVFGIDGAQTTRFRETVPLERLWPQALATTRAERRLLLETEFGVPADTALVCSGGHIDFWHQTDVFLQFCWSVHLAHPDADAHFVWLAEDSTERMLWPLRHDIAHAGLDRWIHVVDRDPPPLLECVAAADVFVRTNRHEMELAVSAAMGTIGTPRVEFDSGDGASEGRVTVPWMDVQAMRDMVLGILEDPAARIGLGPLPSDELTVWDARVGARVIAGLLRAPAPT